LRVSKSFTDADGRQFVGANATIQNLFHTGPGVEIPLPGSVLLQWYGEGPVFGTEK
jgi:hypothetical protein